ncbi:PIN domain-containing protein [Paraburkholderia guartelaensis]|uniref:PIN domain-containing protein n=1 Tax=Paraburkholderia guartelaensis TaxID=2546446 RepID=UPI002AB71886|nr:PIN domain-containing protein [Paraburkholderia guartelaensis]
MKNKASDIAAYKYTSNDCFLIDANVWLYVGAPPSANIASATETYSAALKNIFQSKSTVFLSSTILSEYLNTYVRIEFNAHHKNNYKDFKTFRNSADFQAVGAKASADAQVIAKLCVPMDDRFSSCTLDDVFKDFESGINDFNDSVIIHFCREHTCKLITHDSDFTTGGIDILTGNNRLLSACPA